MTQSSTARTAMMLEGISASFECNPMGMFYGSPSCASKDQYGNVCATHLGTALHRQADLNPCDFVSAQLGGLS